MTLYIPHTFKDLHSLPQIASSDRSFYWCLDEDLKADIFDFRSQGAAALLLIGMHLSDPRPWAAARNPVLLAGEAGSIDKASKRILGKRFRPYSPHDHPLKTLDPFALVLRASEGAGHDFSSQTIHFPERMKEPGKLLARNLIAKATVCAKGETFTFYARNFTEISQCLHAELTLILAMSRRFQSLAVTELDHFELETTLKPCRMCAGFLHALRLKSRSFQVRFEKDDPGPLAQHTLLDQFGYSS